VGRISEEKGLERLLHGYLDLRSVRQVVHLGVGDGPYREEMESALGKEATLAGFLTGEALARLFAYCDIFVFPSATDTLGRAVAEAQASGLPAVVYDIGGPRECIRPDETGFAVPFGDEAGFFSKVELLVDDASLRRRMGRAARAFATTPNWKSVLDGILDTHARLRSGGSEARSPRVPVKVLREAWSRYRSDNRPPRGPASPGRGCSTSRSSSTSAEPYLSWTMAFTAVIVSQAVSQAAHEAGPVGISASLGPYLDALYPVVASRTFAEG
jgi:hypothetical protein